MTRSAVEAWTGADSSAEDGASGGEPEKDAEPQSCLAAVADLRKGNGGEGDDGFAPLAPWGVQLAGNFSKAIALASFERACRLYGGAIGDMRPMIIGRVLRSRGTKKFYQVRLPAATRQAAQTLCGRIRAAGGICLALPS